MHLSWFDSILKSDILIPFAQVRCYTLNWPCPRDPPKPYEIMRYSIRCDKFGDKRWHRTSRDQEAPRRRTSRNSGWTFCWESHGDLVYQHKIWNYVISNSRVNMIKYIITCLNINIEYSIVISGLTMYYYAVTEEAWKTQRLTWTMKSCSSTASHAWKSGCPTLNAFIVIALGLLSEIWHPCFGSFFSSWVWTYLRGN